ncbi:MAG: hypothetical protein AB7O98_15360 [Hyphomonadaceae bacterium]
MVSSINLNVASALLGLNTSSSTTTTPTGVDASVLTAWAQAKAGIGVDVTTLQQDPDAPIAPVWTPGVSPSAEALIQRALTNKAFFDTGAKLYSDLGATGDYQRLFALYSGLTTLQALAGRAEDTTLSKAQQAITNTQFARGLTELQAFFEKQQFEDIRLSQGDRVDAAQTTLAIPSKSEDYLTGLIHKGGLYDKIAGLAADARFNIVATSVAGTVRNVAIDLSEMGSVTRSMGNVISFINSKLSAAGASSRLEAVDQTPKTNTIVIGGKPITTRYVGAKQYALKVDVRANERVAFEPVAAEPAFYAVGTTANGARLIKLEDVSGAAGQPVWLTRPDATDDPIGAYVSTGWLGAGAPYTIPPVTAYEQRSGALLSSGESITEDALRAAGEAVLKLQFADGRTLSISTAWREGDLETWRTRAGESEDRALADDLAERLTQLLHEQGVAAGVDVWEDNGKIGLSVFTDDLTTSSLSISGRSVSMENIDPPGMVAGLRDGIFARRFEAGAVAGASDLFVDKQTFVFTTANGAQTITIDGDEDGIDAAELVSQLNEKIREKNISAAAYLVDDGGALTFRVDALHDVLDVSATLNDEHYEADIVAPGAWVNGGLPAATSGQPFGDAIRTYSSAAASPLLAHAGALDLEIVVATPSGNSTVSVSISAQDRLDYPDAAPGELNATLKARIDAALNAAGVYVSADSADLTQWSAAEGAGHRIASVTVNGDAVPLTTDAPTLGLGGAFSAERSFTSAQAAAGVSDDIAALFSDDTVSVTLDTIWGERTVSASLDPGDPRTLESVALRLNQALAAQGYDAGVVATDLSGGGAGLRVVTGASHSVRGVSDVTIGGESRALSLDPIDAVSHADDPVGALRVTERATRGATAVLTTPATSPFTAPTANSSAWFAGRAFDVSVGGGAKIATARAVATAADGSVYVLADLSDDSANAAIKGARDVALFKYDSAGKLQFTQMLGAAQSASGFALAVSEDGNVAIAGSVEGGLSGASAGKGGTDSFVTMFDAKGKELWTARRGASANDEVSAIAFGPDGQVIVAGKTDSALGGQVALGGSDGYVRGYSAGGAEMFTRQFGTSGTDAASALLVRDDGAGGLEITTGGVENNRGVLRRFTYSAGAGFAAGPTRDIGYFHNGAINTLAADGGAIYVGGQTGADRLTVGAAAQGAVAAQEGFVARLDSGLVSTVLDRTSYIGSARDDAVKSISIVNGDVYAAGVSGGVVQGQGSSNLASSFITRLGDDGASAWTRTFSSAGGAFTLTGLAVDASGASPLDVLGLPRGAVAVSDSSALVNRSALRVGEEFKIGVDGRRLTTIKIGASDTISTLVNTINRAIGAAGKAEIVRENGVERIKITARDGKAVRIDAGRDGYNALPALGLTQGIVAANQTGRSALKTYGLGLIAADLKLDSKANITAAKAEISAAISIVRQAYEALLNPNAKELTDEEKALRARRQNAGAAPEYYTNQLANYQAALAKLTGG